MKATRQNVTKLLNRAGLWETKSKQAASKGDLNRAGRLKTKALILSNKALSLEKILETEND